MTPPVAVVIPVWDSYVDFLGEAIGSVREQRAEVELIVVDNASGRPLPALDDVRVVRSERRLSTGAARNLGLEAVTAPLVVFLDADDLMLPGSLAALLAGLRDTDIAFAMAIVDGDTGGRHRAPAPARIRAGPAATAVRARQHDLVAAAHAGRDRHAKRGRPRRRRLRQPLAGRGLGVAAALTWRGRVRLGHEPGLLYRWRFDSPGREGADADLLDNARFLRQRLRADAAVPGFARAFLPLLGAGQWLAVSVIRPVVRSLRRAD